MAMALTIHWVWRAGVYHAYVEPGLVSVCGYHEIRDYETKTPGSSSCAECLNGLMAKVQENAPKGLWESVRFDYVYQDAQGVEHSDSMTVRIPALPEGWEWTEDGAANSSGWTCEVKDGQLQTGPSAPIEVVRAVLARFG
jgi:hypothetical protein